MVHSISNKKIELTDLQALLQQNITLELSPSAKEKITNCRAYLDTKLKEATRPIYGINTGFGSLYGQNISNDNLEKLQENLVKSHACGTGPEIPEDLVRIMLFLKVQSLAYGNSGVQLETVQRLVDMFNNHVSPVVYEMGSLGASGDLAPLAHLSLPLIGLGEVNSQSAKDCQELILIRNYNGNPSI